MKNSACKYYLLISVALNVLLLFCFLFFNWFCRLEGG